MRPLKQSSYIIDVPLVKDPRVFLKRTGFCVLVTPINRKVILAANEDMFDNGPFGFPLADNFDE